MPLIRLFSGDTYIHIQTQKREEKEKKKWAGWLLLTPPHTHAKKASEDQTIKGRPPAEVEKGRLSWRAGWSFSFTTID